jgi:predicted nucleotide-binding protein
MAKKPVQPKVSREQAKLQISRRDAEARFSERIEKGRLLRATRVQGSGELDSLKNDFYKWDSFNNEFLKRIFTRGELAEEYSSWGGFALSAYEQSFAEKVEELYENIEEKVHRLDSIRERLELIPLSDEIPDERSSSSSASVRSTRVFVVHGRDEVAKTSLEVFLHEIGLEPVVLHRQADEGQTIIEKFERHSDVGYAFILLTPDEIAFLADEEALLDAERKMERRARPNVIFEFGYFVGKLGRARVCCLYTGGVALPSDVSGMIYKRFEKNIEEVAFSVIKDLKAAGYELK